MNTHENAFLYAVHFLDVGGEEREILVPATSERKAEQRVIQYQPNAVITNTERLPKLADRASRYRQ